MKDKNNNEIEEEKKNINKDSDTKDDNFKKRIEANKKFIEEIKKTQESNKEDNTNIIFKLPKQTFVNFLFTLLISVVIDYILFISITGYKPWLEVEPQNKFLLFFTIFTVSFSVLDTVLRNVMLRFFPKIVFMSGGTINILITVIVFISCSFIPRITLVSHFDVIIIIMLLLIARSIINYYINKKINLIVIKKRKK
ncbi:MAG: hypothetical protein WC278_00865 [Bacilli bacterium]|nr:hypothetical protein [Bacilli bacterium]MDD2681758.1 hypothetical protein [Bacilli bacterium]MDD3121345.1 hypothetical protein [Bacilli bacterium]MDD4063821.1 hypothetical protein [Bacilli bacterium]MDD4482065.1 hypothetical protein [Bacilli bacterium]